MSDDMTTDEIMTVIINLDPGARLRMVEAGLWNVEMPALMGEPLVDGSTPDLAIKGLWSLLSDGRKLTLNVGKRNEAHYHWAGKFFARDALPVKHRAAKPSPETTGSLATPSGNVPAAMLPLDTAAKGKKGGAS